MLAERVVESWRSIRHRWRGAPVNVLQVIRQHASDELLELSGLQQGARQSGPATIAGITEAIRRIRENLFYDDDIRDEAAELELAIASMHLKSTCNAEESAPSLPDLGARCWFCWRTEHGRLGLPRCNGLYGKCFLHRYKPPLPEKLHSYSTKKHDLSQKGARRRTEQAQRLLASTPTHMKTIGGNLLVPATRLSMPDLNIVMWSTWVRRHFRATHEYVLLCVGKDALISPITTAEGLEDRKLTDPEKDEMSDPRVCIVRLRWCEAWQTAIQASSRARGMKW